MHRGKLILLITGLDYGGAEKQVVDLAIQLKVRGWDPRVISMLPPRAYLQELHDADIPTRHLNMQSGIPDPRAVFRLVQIIREFDPQLIHSHLVHANLLARLVRPFVQVPVLVCTIHSTREIGRWREWAYRLTDSFCDLTTQVSQIGLERYVQRKIVPRHKICFVPNGVDTVRFQPNLEKREQLRQELEIGDSFAWLAVGRFEKAKDYPNMLQAFVKVLSHHGDAYLLIAGQGSLKEKVQCLAKEHGIEQNVLFLGVRRDIPALMNAVDGYLMSSAWEGMPMVLLEAGASGLPVVATDVGGNRELIVDGRNGFLAPPEDPDALAQAMLRLMGFGLERRRNMGANGRRHIESNYSIDYIVDLWETLYNKLLTKVNA